LLSYFLRSFSTSLLLVAVIFLSASSINLIHGPVLAKQRTSKETGAKNIVYMFYLVSIFPLMRRVIALLLFLPLFCLAQIPKPKGNTYVNDYTNVLTAQEIQQLNVSLRRLEDSTTVQVAMLLIQNLPPGLSIEDFARSVGNSWKVGVNHNGIVYVAVLGEHKQRLEIAERLEGDIPDMIAAQMIDQLRPALQREDYYSALDLLITQIDARLGLSTEDAESSATPPDNSEPLSEFEQEEARSRTEWEKQKARYDSYKPYLAAIILTGSALFVFWAWRYRKRYIKENTINGIYMGVGSAYYASTHPGSGGDFDGGGGGGFGGFGGGGGGGFSGGGASGSW
jgi:uncharacterized protein